MKRIGLSAIICLLFLSGLTQRMEAATYHIDLTGQTYTISPTYLTLDALFSNRWRIGMNLLAVANMKDELTSMGAIPNQPVTDCSTIQ